ncbi:hypothetical protein [Variovorax sp. J22R115]|uniref:hypothetical protein n=1 Tax=Variovorax sp. J22R115 TaxID=3053509 RepID=UPI002575E77B|nr:hypothetical protein [Variovorax sp. J22R115]MDM0052957.1 hypothetical protein [Variovorax sp. J22R115]
MRELEGLDAQGHVLDALNMQGILVSMGSGANDERLDRRAGETRFECTRTLGQGLLMAGHGIRVDVLVMDQRRGRALLDRLDRRGDGRLGM